VIDQATQELSPEALCASGDFGATLRRVRERSGVTLRDIAETTKLPLTSLRALEADRIDQLPGGLFRRAIVRAYAAEIGLNADRVLQAFLTKYPDDVPTAGPMAPSSPQDVPRSLRGALSVIGAIVPIVAGAIYFTAGTAGSDGPRHIADVVPSRGREPLAAQVAPAPLADMNPLAMMISVSARTRLAVIADGREVIARQLEPGEVIRLSVADDVLLMGDNAGAVQFSINGRAGRTLGDPGTPLSARIPRTDYLSWLTPQ
jgi:hypothetical protein